MARPPRVAILGAGFTGLTLAKALRGFADVSIFESASAAGQGRLCSHVDTEYGATFDSGAQFFVAKSAQFRAWLEPFVKAGVLRSWGASWALVEHGSVSRRAQWVEQDTVPRALQHYVGYPTMASFCRAIEDEVLAPTSGDTTAAVRLHRSTRVTAVTRVQRMVVSGATNSARPWQLRVEPATCADGTGGSDTSPLAHRHALRDAEAGFDWVVSALPPADAAACLAGTGFEHLDLVRRTRMQACYTLTALFCDSAWPPHTREWDCALIKGADISWVSVDSSKPGRREQNRSVDGKTAVVVHSTNAWADAQLQAAPERVGSVEGGEREAVAEHLLGELGKQFPVQLPAPVQFDVHRHRQANIRRAAAPGLAALVDHNLCLAACGDWCMRGIVEAAFKSACHVAHELRSAAASPAGAVGAEAEGAE